MAFARALGSWLISLAAAAASAQQLPGDAFVEQLMRSHGAPGLALVVVKDGQVTLRGYGTTGAGNGEKVDARTLFQVGSCTKSFTGVAAAALVGAGKLGWDDPVRKTLPEFELSDPLVSSQVTLRDLLTARSGLTDGLYNYRTWYGASLSPTELLARLRHLPLQARFRDVFEAVTENYTIAGEVIARAGAASYADVVRRQLLEPIGMQDAFFDWPRRPNGAKRALPHVVVGGRLQTLPDRSFSSIDAAGTLVVHATDLAKWIRFLLDDGKAGGRQIVAVDALREVQSPQVVVPKKDETIHGLYPGSPLVAFGLGSFVSSHAGVRVIDAAGDFYGMSCLITVVPSTRTGFAVLINAERQLTLAYTLKMRLLGDLPATGNADGGALLPKPGSPAGPSPAPPVRALNTRPSLPLQAYAGRYAHPAFGPLDIVLDADGFRLRLNEVLVAQLDHWHFDTFRARWSTTYGETPDEMVSFTVDPEGKISAVSLAGFARFVR